MHRSTRACAVPAGAGRAVHEQPGWRLILDGDERRGASTTTRRPALTSKATTFRQAIQLSGHPGNNNTGSPVPAVT